ncbi:MAG: 4-hydroxy-3-methylbut-2-enyl diphosphate reductase [Zoogloeaceae bacterium]|jgi:4-hydroxy-3-methylbut-2-enyl diphosphate reductase|nr:4-hydroxy-3-methylbut-2-enyl diphosphate reductase [Zoogloeaceae bacterium]
MEILLANPRGFCAGVERAITIVEHALAKFGAPVYVRHEVVHNRFVCDMLRAKGAVFVEEMEKIPPGSTVIFSAHGVPRSVRREAEARGFRVFDATCPLVTKVHVEIERMRAQGREVVIIGHRGHPEVEGAMGQSETGLHLVEKPADVFNLKVARPEALSYVTQTTLSMDDAADVVAALRERFPGIQGPKKADICYATQNRQDAVKALAKKSGLVLIVGSQNSSNSRRLQEVAARAGAQSHLIDHAGEIDPAWLREQTAIGISAGASAPEKLVEETVQHLNTLIPARITEQNGVREEINFPLPKGL